MKLPSFPACGRLDDAKPGIACLPTVDQFLHVANLGHPQNPRAAASSQISSHLHYFFFLPLAVLVEDFFLPPPFAKGAAFLPLKFEVFAIRASEASESISWQSWEAAESRC